jgi:hypothetical protein
MPAVQSGEMRRVLVLFLPVAGSRWNWANPGDLLPYLAAAPEKEKEASAAMRDK